MKKINERFNLNEGFKEMCEQPLSIDLKELKKKAHLVGGHMSAAYASFYGGDMPKAGDFAKKSKEALDDLIKELTICV